MLLPQTDVDAAILAVMMMRTVPSCDRYYVMEYIVAGSKNQIIVKITYFGAEFVTEWHIL